MIQVGIIGMGFMGRTHAAAYLAAQRDGLPCRLAALCDRDLGRVRGSGDARGNLAAANPAADVGEVRLLTDPADLLADPDIHLVSVCTYTDSHVDLARAALAAGKHVLVEKPLALRPGDARRVLHDARRSGRACMPAMCMRFWPGWDWLARCVRQERFGMVCSAVFQRLGSRPAWAEEFYADESRSGGALFDLHVHDVDFVLWCLGRPRSVFCAGHGEHFTTSFRFEPGPRHVTAEGAWDLSPGMPFRMRYTVVFEGATADWELAREPSLVLHHQGRSEPVSLPAGTGYDGEVRHLVSALAAGRTAEIDSMLQDAVGVIEVLGAIARSRESGRPVDLYL